MNIESVLTILSVVISSLILGIGVWLLTGWYLGGLWPDNVRYAAGAVMTLYGLYRIVTARSRFRRSFDRNDADDNVS